MKKKDSSDILLIICIGFVVAIVLGLILQSCRTARLDNSSSNSTHSTYSDKLVATDGRMSLSQLSQRWGEDLHIIVRDYAIHDSCGKPVPALERETELSRKKQYQQDSVASQQEQKSSMSDISSDYNNIESEDRAVERQPIFSPSWCWLLIPVIFVLYILYKSRKKLSE